MHRKLPSIEQFPKIFARETYHDTRRALTYRPKIKLHGTCMGVRVDSAGTVAFQCKTHDLTPDHDLSEFAAHMAPKAGAWAAAAGPPEIIFYGEWAGPKIGKGDAIQRTDKKRFFLFAIGIGSVPHPQDKNKITSEWMITEPDAIRAMVPEGLLGDDIRVLEWEGETITLDFTDEVALHAALDDLNARVDAVAICDPFVARTFGIEHSGEGYVYTPTSSAPGQLSTFDYSKLTFKAKTDKHRVQKMAKPAVAQQPLPQNAADFVAEFCTHARMDQAMFEVCEQTPNMRKTGEMIAWMIADIVKEAADEIASLEQSGVPFDRIKPMIAQTTRTWFHTQINAA